MINAVEISKRSLIFECIFFSRFNKSCSHPICWKTIFLKLKTCNLLYDSDPGPSQNWKVPQIPYFASSAFTKSTHFKDNGYIANILSLFLNVQKFCYPVLSFLKANEKISISLVTNKFLLDPFSIYSNYIPWKNRTSKIRQNPFQRISNCMTQRKRRRII